MAVVFVSNSKKPKRKIWRTAVLSIAGLTVVLIVGGALLITGGIVLFSNDCSKNSAHTRGEDRAVHSSLNSIVVAGNLPSIQSLSNPDCIDGNYVNVSATYDFNGSVTEARTALADALHMSVPVSLDPKVLPQDFGNSDVIDSIEENYNYQGRGYTATYDFATPYACISINNVCDTVGAYNEYDPSSETVKDIRLVFSQQEM